MTPHRPASPGFSLIETAIIILFVSLAMVPVITTMGGVNDTTNTSAARSANISAVSSRASKEVVAANTIMERALAGDETVSFNASTLFTTPGQTVVTPRRQFYGSTSRAYNQAIEYDWVVRDLSHLKDTSGQLINWANQPVSANDAESVAPTGNFVQQATLRVYENPGDANPILSLPTYFYRSTCGSNGVDCGDVDLDQTGIVLVVDRSGSMQWSISAGKSKGATSTDMSAPWLKNRYTIGGSVPTTPGDPSIRINDIFDDTTLDTTYMLPVAQGDNPDTPYSEQYILPAVNGFSNNCADVPTTLGDPGKDVAKYFATGALTYNYGGDAGNGEPATNATKRREVISAFCGRNGISYGGRDSQANWDKLINDNMSRIEALRNALLSLLVKLEQNQFLVANMEMGLVTFSSGTPSAVKQVDMEKAANPPGPVDSLKFVNMRYRSAMINREGTGQISASNGTNMLAGLQQAATMLYAKDFDNRLIIVLSDGAVNSGSTPTNVKDFAKKVGGCPTVGNPACYAGSNGKTITLFTVGLIEADDALMLAMAQRTPNGQFFLAQSVTDLQPIFDQIAFQIERLVLNSMAKRYHLPVQSGA